MRSSDIPAQAASPWIVSPAWDLGWIQCGFWLIAAHLLLRGSPAAFAAWYALAFLSFWMTHRAGTAFMSFGLREYRALAAAQRARFVALPLAWFVFAFAVLFAPPALLPLTAGARLRALVAIRFGCDALHFGGQHYGVLSLYRLRARQDPRSRFKSVEKAFALTAAVAAMILPVLFSRVVPAVAPALAPSAEAARVGCGGAFVLFALFAAAAERAEPRASAPKLLYIAYLAAVGVAALSARGLAEILLIVGLQHYVVATGITTRMIANAEPPRGASAWARFMRAPAAPFALLFALGLLPVLWGYRSGQAPALDGLLKNWRSDADRGAGFKWAAALAYGFSYAHNVWDAAVFRFKDPDVRAVSLPLILGRETEPARAAAAPLHSLAR
jgi:hypothetical protein